MPTESNSFLTERPGQGYAAKQTIYADTQENQAALNPPPVDPVVETPVEGTEGVKELPKEKIDVKKLTDLVKLQRRLEQKEAAAKEILSKADSIKGAFDEKDLVVALQKLGLNPDDIYKKMTEFALNKLKDKPIDPVQAELQETKAKLQEYANAQKKMIEELNNERAMAAHKTARDTQVAPIFKENPSAYQILTKTFGSEDAAIDKVYEECYNEYCRTGIVVDPKEAATAMNKFYKDTYLESVKQLKEMEDFKSFFKDDGTNDVLETGAESFSKALSAKLDSPARLDSVPAKTLTNNIGNTSSTPQIASNGKVDHLKNFFKKHDIQG